MRGIRTRLFVAVALALAVGLATAVSPFASSNPDGLEKVAERLRRLRDRHITDDTADRAVMLDDLEDDEDEDEDGRTMPRLPRPATTRRGSPPSSFGSRGSSRARERFPPTARRVSCSARSSW